MNAAFFNAVRPLFGGSLSQAQVDGLKQIARTWADYGDGDDGKLAYILSTAWHETAQTMQPVRETLAKTDAKAKEILTKAWRSGKLPGVKTDYWSSGFFGRGYVQLTHEANYRKAGDKLGLDLVAKPSLALDPDIAARILIRGMLEGWFTGKKLGDYIAGADRNFLGARRVVNGTDKASLITDHAGTFLRALEAARAAEPAPPPSDPKQPPTAPARGWLAALLAFLLSLLKGFRK